LKRASKLFFGFSHCYRRILKSEKLALDAHELSHVPALFIAFGPLERTVDGCVPLDIAPTLPSASANVA
jgi:hypothetical protein